VGKWLFVVDVALGFAIPTVLYFLRRAGRLPYLAWPAYWLGMSIGLVWELALHYTGPRYAAAPSYVNLTRFPMTPLMQPFAQARWHGGLFVAGLLLVHRLVPPPHWRRFRWRELLVLLAWGQVQGLAMELTAAQAGLWTLVPHPWNPALFRCGAGQITLLPRLVWLIAPVVFYLGALRLQAWLEKQETRKRGRETQ
jgi:hypothetical protein